MQGKLDPAQEPSLGIQDEIAGGRSSVRDHHHAHMMLTAPNWLRPISEQRTEAQTLRCSAPPTATARVRATTMRFIMYRSLRAALPPCQPFTRYPVLLWCQAEVDPDLTEPEWTNGS